ncbi:hypothetical protein [Parabacteroides sp. AM08-6]|uniref:hypothetical protein n=1 Tax=Parabacteroides sp. AM08-6 TaxID=2292053 RepID=UPI000EFE1047|nr:hypothetical protein [Parabacteroides sp. AM08-6]RHJ81887.1 hypothetical protein DW103_10465 [Parabacteroides sp. AM08-6]
MCIESRLALALQAERVCNLPGETLLVRTSALLRQVYILCGFRMPDAKDFGIFTAKLASDLFESFSFLTLEEIRLCFEWGAKGEYGEFMGLNLRTLTHWLKTYKTSDIRYRAVVSLEKQRAKTALPPVSEAYKEERERVFLQQIFEQYRNGYPLERLYPSRVYLSLQKRGILRNTPAEKHHAMQVCAGWRPASNLKMDEDTRQTIVKQQAMAWLLKGFFDGLIKEGRGLSAG